MTRTCPACGLAAAPGDRYCGPCGSAPDRTSWIDGPDPMADPREAYEFEAAGVGLDPEAIDEWMLERG